MFGCAHCNIHVLFCDISILRVNADETINFFCRNASNVPSKCVKCATKYKGNENFVNTTICQMDASVCNVHMCVFLQWQQSEYGCNYSRCHKLLKKKEHKYRITKRFTAHSGLASGFVQCSICMKKTNELHKETYQNDGDRIGTKRIFCSFFLPLILCSFSVSHAYVCVRLAKEQQNRS